jgi:hypothetical protein
MNLPKYLPGNTQKLLSIPPNASSARSAPLWVNQGGAFITVKEFYAFCYLNEVDIQKFLRF